MMRTRRPARGFTLIELLVVVVIAGVLAAVAMPSYLDSVRKGKRTSAKARMTEVAGRLQQYYSEKSGAAGYTTTLTDLGYPSGTLLSEAKAHAITVSAGPTGIDSSYKVEAKVVTNGSDPACPTITLSSQGAFTPAGC